MKPNPEIAHATGRVLWAASINHRGSQLGEGIVIGTSALFPYIQSWARSTQTGGSLLVEINAERTPVSEFADLVLLGRAGEILPEIVTRTWGS